MFISAKEKAKDGVEVSGPALQHCDWHGIPK